MDQSERDLFDRIASGDAAPPSDIPAELRPLASAARLLVAEGRAVDPPSGSLARTLIRAAQPRQRGVVWLRPAFALAMVALLVLSLGGAAYASTPGEPLFGLQRTLDDAYVTAPRSAAGSASASVSVANRRVAQAAIAAKKASPEVLRLTLDDARRYFDRARADVAKLPDGVRQLQSSNLAAIERAARDRLAEARQETDGENNNILNEAQTDLGRDADRDENDGQFGPGQQQQQQQDQQQDQGGKNEGTRP
jgi:hypothetical protein